MSSEHPYPCLVWLARHVRPCARVGALHEVNPEALVARGIRGLMLDLDNTLVPWNTTRLSDDTRAWVADLLARGMKLCIISNASGDSRVQFVAESLGIPYVSQAVKPSRRAFRYALAEMGLEPTQVAAAGDQLFTDVLGGNRLGLFTILVTPVTRRDFIGTKAMRLMELIANVLLRSVPVETVDLR